MSRGKRWGHRLLALALAIIICEVGLSVASVVSPRLRFYVRPPWDQDVTVADAELGKRISPYYPGVDAWGFRNRRVPDTCDILVIGDSMAYGYAAPADKCWPRHLERLTGQSVYNMSCGGYAPCEYHVLLERGMRLKPKTVIVCLYLGNDISGAYGSVYQSKRAQDFASDDEAVKEALADADQTESFAEVHARHRESKPERPETRVNPIRKSLSDNSALYGLMRSLYGVLSERQHLPHGENVDQIPFAGDDLVVFDVDPKFATAFVDPEYYARGMDLDDPRIVEGKRVTEAVLLSALSKLTPRHIRLLVVLIPTKHAVYAQLVKDRQQKVPDSYFELVKKEQRLTNEIESFLEKQSIGFVRTTSALRSCFEKGFRPYPATSNTHPNANGYAAIAEAVAPLVITGEP